MAYWNEDKITQWEQDWFNKSLTTNEYTYIAQELPGYFLLLLHIWNAKKWEHDWIWADEPYKDKNGKQCYKGIRTYAELTNKVRAKGFNNTTEYKQMIDEVEQSSYQQYKERKDALNKLKEIW